MSTPRLVALLSRPFGVFGGALLGWWRERRGPPAKRRDAPATSGATPAREVSRAIRPRLRFRLRTVLIFASLSVLVMPLLGVYVLRLHEDTLLRQTQTELTVVAALLASSFRASLLEATPPSAQAAPNARSVAASPDPPSLDLSLATIAPPFPGAKAGKPASPLAQEVGNRLAGVVQDARLASAAAIRLLDSNGAVVATTEDDLGLSLGHVDEVRRALQGVVAGSLRRVPAAPAIEMRPIVRGSGVEVHLALPVVLAERVVGAVTAARRPSTIVDALVDKRFLLLQGAAVFLAIAVGLAIVTARTLVLPIHRLRRGAGRVSRGETEHFERGRHYRVRELADLADSIEAMVLNLQQRTSYLREFARQVNHELKTPIAAARGAAELLSDHLPAMTAQEARHFVDNLAADIARLDRLAQRLLDLAQADLAAASEEVADVHAIARELAGPAVRVGDGRAMARVPPASLRAILENLVQNALENGARRVDVDVEQAGGKVRLRVEDDGPGIAPEDAARVFNPFYTTRANSGGTGLGLAICRALAQNAGGSIALARAESGAAFTVTLQAAP